MNRYISQKFRFYSFICIALLMLVHGYNLEVAYLQPDSTVAEPLTFTTFIEYFLANGALRFRIPMLFIISGYIFAMQDRQPYGARVKKRFMTLMIPYFIWSAVALGITYLLQQFPYTAELVKRGEVDQLGDYRPYDEIGWGGILFRWAVVPVAYQLWFIRSLFIYNLLYPVFRWGISRYPVLWFGLLSIMWYLGMEFIFVEAQGMLFFSAGIWLWKSHYPIDRKPAWFSHYLSWLFFLGLSVIRTFMAFELEPNTAVTHFTMITLQAVVVVSGVIAVWFGCDALVRWCMQRRWFVWTTSFSFVIYGLHVPLLVYVTMYFYDTWKGLAYYRLLTYFFVPVVVLVICVAVGALLRRVLPGVYRVMTGGRGF